MIQAPRLRLLIHSIAFIAWCSPLPVRADLNLGIGVNVPRLEIQSIRTIGSHEFQAFATAGFRHVRQPIEPSFFGIDAESTAQPDPAAVAALRSRILLAQTFGIRTIVDLHPGPAFKSKLFAETSAQQAFVEFWENLAAQLADIGDAIIFEPLNEPGPDSQGKWWPLQNRIIDAIRAVDGRRTIIASGVGYSSINDLLSQKPYRHGNIIYNVHFYSPMVFTHQGANWGSQRYKDIRGVPWPLQTDVIKNILGAHADMRSIAQNLYDTKVSGQDDIDAAIGKLAEWAKQHHVKVMCNEFGVYRKGGVKPDDRVRYLRDVADALNRHGIDWSIWEFVGGFGIAADDDGALDHEILAALRTGMITRPTHE